jgi:hypothetical protein
MVGREGRKWWGVAGLIVMWCDGGRDYLFILTRISDYICLYMYHSSVVFVY